MKKEIWWAIVYVNYTKKSKQVVGFSQALIFYTKKDAMATFKKYGYNKKDTREGRQNCGWEVQKIAIMLNNLI